jgi:hypothetical protein
MKTVFIGKRLIAKTLVLAISINFLFPSSASAGKIGRKIKCIVNPACWVGKGLGAGIPTKFDVNVNGRLENVDELRDLIDFTSQRLEQAAERAAKTTSRELQITIDQAFQELQAYTAYVDEVARKRIADLDARIQAKLLFIQQYTEQVNAMAENLINQISREGQIIIEKAGSEGRSLINEAGAASRSTLRAAGIEVERIIGVTGAEARSIVHEAEAAGLSIVNEAGDEIRSSVDALENSTLSVIDAAGAEVLTIVQEAGTQGKYLIEAFGAEGRSIVNTAGLEARLTISAATDAAQIITGTISKETQEVIKTANNELQETILIAENGARKAIADAEKGRLRVLEGTLFIINRTAEITLSVGGILIGIFFLFIALIIWGICLLIYKLDQAHPNREIVLFFMRGTIVAACLPFILVVPQVRAQILFSVGQIEPYADGSSPESLQPKAEIWRVAPEVINVQKGASATSPILVVYGKNLLSSGSPSGDFGGIKLPLIGKLENELRFDLSPVYQNPGEAQKIDIKLDPANEQFYSVTVIDYTLAQTPSSLPLPQTVPNKKNPSNNPPELTVVPLPVPSPPIIPKSPPVPSPSNVPKPTPTPFKQPFKQTKKNNYGERTYLDGMFYKGELKNGLPDGEGLSKWPNGDEYLGEWKNGKINGKGVWQGYDGQMVKGIWENGDLVKELP